MEANQKINYELKELYKLKKIEIKNRLDVFQDTYQNADDKKIFEELCFCILSSGTGPKVAQRSLEKIKEILITASESSLFSALDGVHKYPEKASFLFLTREYLTKNFELDLRTKLNSFVDKQEQRDFLAKNRDIKGIGYVQASHFLRNIGNTGYAILDKNILKTLYEFGVIQDIKQPTSKKQYLEKEEKMKEFSKQVGIEIDELDLLLWCRRTGYIPR